MARKKLTDQELAKRRGEILSSAMAVFDKHKTVDEISFRNIATEMGLSYSAPYRYFKNKEELVNGLRAQLFRWVEDYMWEAVQKEKQPDKQLDAITTAFIKHSLEQPHRFGLMFFKFAGAQHDELAEARRKALHVMTKVIISAQEKDSFPKEIDPLTATHFFWMSAHALVSLQIADYFVMGRDFEFLMPAFLKTVRIGMVNPENSAVQRIELE